MEHKPDKFETLSGCPVCSSPKLVPFKKSTFNIHRINQEQIKITDSEYGKTWDLSRCENCTHVFANPAPLPSFIQTLYSQVKDPLYEEEARGRTKNFERILHRLEKIHPEKGGFFDVGAATGILINLANGRGWKAEGIESSSWAVRFAIEKYGLQILEGSFETASLLPGHYTTVTMVDFIEHTVRPVDAVQKAAKILKPGGTLCLVTPDIRSLTARIAGSKWWHFRPGHLGYFTAQSLDLLLSSAGLSVVKKRRYSWTFSAFYLISRNKKLHFLIKNPRWALFWKKIPLKLALFDSLEIYARKEKQV
ncbi:MAG: class I SAM-dependent methyltransferase [Candidatus Aminicenantes bacterium]|jgi:2-polyprenyl-3-methyl-5-hydroxy-6-metoxy-1,4-benzoquinol methylase